MDDADGRLWLVVIIGLVGIGLMVVGLLISSDIHDSNTIDNYAVAKEFYVEHNVKEDIMMQCKFMKYEGRYEMICHEKN